MFKDSFSSFSVDNLATAKDFYSKILGLKVVEEKQMGILRVSMPKSGHVMIYPKDDHSPATFTVLNFIVADIEKSVDELTSKHVSFEHYDNKYMKTDKKGIARDPGGSAMAWFKDPAGNILSVMQDKS